MSTGAMWGASCLAAGGRLGMGTGGANVGFSATPLGRDDLLKGR